MDNESSFPQRKHPRLKTYDYSRNGMYFVTICTKDKGNVLSSITPDGQTLLTGAGVETERHIKMLQKRFEGIEATNYVIMPNHIHMVISVFQRPVIIRANEYTEKPTLCDIVGAFKSLTSRDCWKKYRIKHLFQKSFHEHIIRTRESLAKINDYVNKNPSRWQEDCFYVE